MTVEQVAIKCGFDVVCAGDGLTRDVTGVFCCDLLSWAMARAPADSAWITVMGNINAIAVAVLADTSCLVLAENAAIDQAAIAKATAQGVAVLRTEQPAFEAALAIHEAIH
ncbi:DRTGG domain-containing protein [Hydrogenoanaerobacterium sp.]|uniref:DRTGG domain-containing protein n=1 Tax=Hydrogenoanaerobacterium sp. TaxID=2953763 RepID=UPI00289D39E6|nr:DRTGG domain-containing protein [Hydrogenoanaerobacterium sp.]